MASYEKKRLEYILEEMKEIFSFTAPEAIIWKFGQKIYPILEELLDEEKEES